MSQEQQDDFIEDSLALAPEPYRTIIRKRLDEGVFAEQLNEMQRHYDLSEDQIDTVTLMTFRAACDPDILDSLKDALIAEAGVSYEVAVKIQRDITRDVLLPVKQEGDAIAGTQRGQTLHTEAKPSGGAAVIFSDPKVRLTARTLTMGGATYPVSTLAGVVGPYLVPHMGFIGDIFQWGDWYVAIDFIDGANRFVYWSTRDEAGRFARAIREVMA